MASRILWVLRHAKSSRRPPAGGGDHERTLSHRGRIDADSLGAHLADGADRLGLEERLMPELVLCSTASRTVETTERVLSGLVEPPPVTYLRSFYGASPEGVFEELAAVDDSVASVMVVGHNPTVELLVAAMPRSAVPSLSGGFATCALAVFDVPVASWSQIAAGPARVVGVFQPPY